MSTPSTTQPDLLLSAIVDSSEDAILSKNLHSIITSWNKAAERIFGYTAEEMIGQPVCRMFPPDRLSEEAGIIARIQRGERVEHFETIRLRKDGTTLPVSLTISPIRDASGVIIGASKIARDITEQISIREKLAAAYDQLKKADQMKREFLATLSHELRTPLNAILLWVQLLRESHTPADLVEGLDIIGRNAQSQSRLIEDLLDMSRIESGKVSLDLQRLDLAAVASAAMDTVRPAASAKGIRLSSAFSSIKGVMMGDKARVQQILWNLLTNAIKFTPKEGHVHVVIERVHSHVEISVTDSGEGIAPGMLGQIFERFRQVDASVTRRHGGLGLGLSIARHLTELHGGTLRVSSRGLGEGATFTLSFPLVSSQRPPAHIHAEQRAAEVDGGARRADLMGVNVLAVDDDADSLDVIRRILEGHGAEVRTAGSMAEALAEFDRAAPHVIISDIGMPDHDGYELMARLREKPACRGIPAVALTALARPEDRTRALRAGFQMHLAKPTDSEELVAIVQNLAALRSCL